MLKVVNEYDLPMKSGKMFQNAEKKPIFAPVILLGIGY